MVKGLTTYTLFLIVADAFFNLVINYIQGNPYSVIIVSLIVRAVCLSILFLTIGSVTFVLLRNKSSNLSLVVTTLVIHALLPVIIFALKDNNKTLFEVYSELHSELYLFSLIYLPYLLASLVCVLLANKLKLF